MILSDNETKLDLLNNQAIAKTIVSIVRDSKESVSIGVHGDWGAGKSSILLMVETLLNPEEKISDTEADDLDLDQWDFEEPDNAEQTESDEPITGIITCRFNSWQYQGFEDAKIALMGAIVKALQKEAKSYYKKHPVKGALKRLKETCKNIWRNIDKLSLAKNVAKIGVSAAMGTTPLALLNIGTQYAESIFTDDAKRDEFISKVGALLKSSSSESSTYKEMAEFRLNYNDLFKAAHIEKLVVLIDDLDRCLPNVAIETLEAVRMFLSMENTVFIIAADDSMIRYSVKEYFPRVLEKEGEETLKTIDYTKFSEKYLEKLIQVPMHIPRIGIKEAQMYVLLLMIQSQIGEDSKELKHLAETVIEKLSKPWALEPLTPETIKKIMGDQYENVIEQVKIAKSIDKILAENTDGNPRNIKRFVNMLLIRTMVAYNRGFNEKDLETPILAKMMLAEQYNYNFYKAIAAEMNEDGTCSAFDENHELEGKLEEKGDQTGAEESQKVNSKKQDSKVEATIFKPTFKSKEFGDALKDDAVKAWMSIEPSLAGVDLRPYYFACTEKEDFFFSSQEERLRELIYAVRRGKLTSVSKRAQIENLENSDAKYIFNVVTQDVISSNLSAQKVPKIIEGLRVFVKFRSELQNSLVEFLRTLPLNKLGVWVVNGWEECVPKASEAGINLKAFLKEIAEKATDPLVKSAASREVR